MSGVPTGDFGVGSWVERRARMVPERVALIAGSESLTYRELAGRIRCLANGLHGLGVGRGDRVAWIGPNHGAFLETLFAVGQLGAMLAPVNHRLDPDERAFVLAQTEPSVLIHHDVDERATLPSIRHRLAIGRAAAGSISYEELVGAAPDDPIDATVGLDDLLFLPHTSGTTGGPKAVMLSHGNVTWNAINFLSSAGIHGDDVTIAIAPFHRVGGTGVNVLPVLFAGGTVVVPDDTRPERLLDLMERQRVTVGFGNPDLLDALTRAEGWHTADLTKIRFIVTGGAPVPERLIRAYLDRGVTLLQGYGLSEAAPLALLLEADQALRKIGSAGRPPLHVDVRIVDGAGADVGTGVTGELLVRGPNVMVGYWRRPDATRAALTDSGWLRTGDAAWADRDGDVWIVDRLDARFITAGEVVYPGDVERVLLAHPAIADAGVVGVRAPVGGWLCAAFVVTTPGGAVTADELRAFCVDRLAAAQVPTSFSFVDELPRNAAGKLRRDALAKSVTGGDPPPGTGGPARG